MKLPLNKRGEKIRFLKELYAGKRNLIELISPQLLVVMRDMDTNSYHCERLNRDFSEDEFNLLVKNPKFSFIVVERSSYEPS